MDPCYKTKYFNELVKEKVESQLLKLLEDRLRNDDEISVPAEKRARLSSPVRPNNSNVQSILSLILSNSDDDEDETTSLYEDKFMMITGILNEYNKEKRISITDDPLL